MSEFEFIEAAHLAMDWLVNASMNSVAVTFAYIIASYFAGSGLSKFSAIGLSLLYSLFLIGPMSGIVVASGRYIQTTGQYHIEYPDGWALQEIPSLSTMLVMGLLPVALGWLASIAFLHLYIRKAET